ncbi:MAG: type 1 glutamine amidotransferase domain-containing protein [Nitrososphaeraceae archaeon]
MERPKTSLKNLRNNLYDKLEEFMSKKIIILIEDLFEDVEVIYPYYRLIEEGYEVNIVGPVKGREYKGKHGMSLKSDISSKDSTLDNVAALIIPGGYAPDRMVRDENMVNLVKKAVNKCCVIGAICHGPLMLVEADVIKNKKVTGFKSIRTPLKLAGGILMDNKVVTDGNIITAQDAADVVEFMKDVIVLIESNN